MSESRQTEGMRLGVGDSAAWTAAVVAIIAAVISLVTMGIAVWQAVLARRQAGSAWEQSLSARRSADVAEQALVVSNRAAAAAERQAAEALRQNEITEQLLKITRDELEVEIRRRREEQAAKYVATVHDVLLAAEAVRGELRDNAAAVIAHQGRTVDALGIGPSLFIFFRAEEEWEAAVNTIRVDKPPAIEVTTAIDNYNNFTKRAAEAIEAAQELAED